MRDFLSTPFLGNTAQDWMIALAVALVVMALVRVAIRLILRRLKSVAAKTDTDVDDLIAELLGKTQFLFVVLVALYAGAVTLGLPAGIESRLSTVLILGFLIQGALWANGIINYLLDGWAKRKFEADPTMSTALGAIGFLVRFGVWATFVMLALDNAGVDVGPLVASLGIGGVALALALQGVLGDLFASLSIIFDEPFVVGDSIQVGDLSGTVEHVGLKSTRVRALTGEQLVFSNSDLLSSRIRNYQHRQERRCAFTLGVTYQTSLENLEKIPGLVKEIIEALDNARFDRSFLQSFGDSAVNFDTVYYVSVPDFAVYAKAHHEMNLEIFRRFAEEGIEFAYPTQTLHIAGGAPAGGRSDS
jgi:small-conductance mechanosensitive channel